MNHAHDVTLISLLALVGCSGEALIVDPGFAYEYADIELPAHYTEAVGEGIPNYGVAMDFDNTPRKNPITNEGARLGRVLFYDLDLSQNRTVACASCHKQELGFDDDAVLSEGFEGGSTGRHSMGLTNARFYENGRFFWDQRAKSLEAQVLMPFQDEVEMGMTLDEVVERVEEDERYAELFDQAFGDPAIDSQRISFALAQFVRSMVSTTTRYDKGRAKVDSILDPFPRFSDLENTGKELFYAPPPQGGLGCFACHGTDAQIGIGAISNGLDATVTDEGYGEVTGAELDMGTFKVPSLRNIAVRGRFMHDGRFGTLEEVLEHYSSGIEYHPTLFPFLLDGQGGARSLNLTTQETAALLAFMDTLTDEAMLTDPKFSDPGW
jgi:cytochrome c peroxidase